MIAPPRNEPGELHVLAETDDISALCLEGEFDLSNAPQILEEGERLLADGKQLILDLSDATFVDSSVIHALFRLGAAATTRGRVVVLQVGTTRLVERVLEISNIDRVLPRVSTRPEALQAIRQLHRPDG